MKKAKQPAAARHSAGQPFMAVMRELVRAYQAFETYSNARVRLSGLTPPQFDVIATLGNTRGMTFKELGERSLTTKGTLTGIIDRLEQKGLVKRVTSSEDRRSTLAVLTPRGEALFRRVFPRQIAHLKERFDRLTPAELRSIEDALRRLKELF